MGYIGGVVSANIPQLRDVLSCKQPLDLLCIPQTSEVPYCYYKLVTNINRTVNKYFCVIPVVYCLIYKWLKCCFSQLASRTQTTVLQYSNIAHITVGVSTVTLGDGHDLGSVKGRMCSCGQCSCGIQCCTAESLLVQYISVWNLPWQMTIE